MNVSRLGFALTIFALILSVGASDTRAAGEYATPTPQDWSFNGPFGRFDIASAQRGLQVYAGVCAVCHSIEQVSFRNLADLGYSEAQVEAFAAGWIFQVPDEPDEFGMVGTRPAVPADRFQGPYANEQAARAANLGAYPPDLSLITKARSGGADYLYAFLTGFEEPPADVELRPGQYYNPYFGGPVGMPNILESAFIEYADGTEATPEQMARDLTHFFAWTAEPKMEERKELGIGIVLFLIIFTGMLYAVKRKVWADQH